MAEQKEESVSFTITYYGMGGRGAPLRAAAFVGGLSYKDAFTTGMSPLELTLSLSLNAIITMTLSHSCIHCRHICCSKTGPAHAAVKKAGNRRWSGVPELTLHDKDGNDVITIGQSNVCLKLIGMTPSGYTLYGV